MLPISDFLSNISPYWLNDPDICKKSDWMVSWMWNCLWVTGCYGNSCYGVELGTLCIFSLHGDVCVCIYIYIYIYIYILFSPVKPELGVIPSVLT